MIARDGARYRIGPLTTYVDAGELEAWHVRARPGDEMVYAIGPALGHDAATPKVARRLQDRGEAMLFLRREGNGIHYVIRKREKAAAPRSVTSAAHAPSGPERRLYDTLVEIADAGLPLPSLEMLAERAGLSDRFAARYRLQILQSQGFVRVSGPMVGRVVEIVETGQRTAGIVKQRA